MVRQETDQALQRFVVAQEPIYQQVVDELRAGRKRTHWMWFIFPQIAGLGHSATARHFAISSIEEARAYLQHPVLGRRLFECTALVNAAAPDSAHAIFGSPDDLKFRSSMTLFAHAGGGSPFSDALQLFYNGNEDQDTVASL